VVQMEYNSFGLRDFDGGEKITVPGNQHRISDLMLRRKLHKIHGQQNVHPFLFEPHYAVVNPTCKFAEPNLESWRATRQGHMECLMLSETFFFFFGWLLRLLRQAIVIVRAEQICSSRNPLYQSVEGYLRRTKLLQNLCLIGTINKDGDSCHLFFLVTEIKKGATVELSRLSHIQLESRTGTPGTI
jgi:hypothetical protein